MQMMWTCESVYDLSKRTNASISAMHDHMPARAPERPKRKKRGGRRKGTRNKRTFQMMAEAKARLAEMSIGKHEKPLDFLLEVMGTVDLPLKLRMHAAEKALPFMHYRLISNENFNATMNMDPERSSAEIATIYAACSPIWASSRSSSRHSSAHAAK